MYFALTGQPPFTRDNVFAVMMAHARDPVLTPSQVFPACPLTSSTIVLPAWPRNPPNAMPP